ncbi:hypothetical protein CCS92_34320, partial [Methylobacterium radiotolerans]
MRPHRPGAAPCPTPRPISASRGSPRARRRSTSHPTRRSPSSTRWPSSPAWTRTARRRRRAP